ncbi:MAG TPA: hypothetical protein VK837_09150 [Longimicrobiales bacterium]|nr:hypothetical protein [Longimicrobiales bacterium]
MHVALTEILRCPRCAAGLVLLTDRREGSRAIEGSLGCPQCEARYDVRAGVADLRVPESSETPSASASPDSSQPTAEDAVRLAALLGLESARGVVLLIGSPARSAEALAALVPGVEVAIARPERPAAEPALAGPKPARPAAPRDTSSVLLTGDTLPLADRRLAAVAMDASAHVAIQEAARVLAPGRRVLVEGAGGRTRDDLEAAGCVIVAEGAGALVAERSGAPEPPRLYQLA